jgi:hypothetical protein
MLSCILPVRMTTWLKNSLALPRLEALPTLTRAAASHLISGGRGPEICGELGIEIPIIQAGLDVSARPCSLRRSPKLQPLRRPLRKTRPR